MKSQKGSAHVVIIVILVVALVGTLGFVFWQNFLQPKAEDKTAVKDESSQQTGANSNKDVKPETLLLSDSGAKFTITDKLKQAGIEVAKTGSNDTNTFYSVSTARQRALQITEENIDKVCDAGSAVDVIRNTDSPSSDSGGAHIITSNSIGGFYYYWRVPSAGGCDGPDTRAIVTALETLEAV